MPSISSPILPLLFKATAQICRGREEDAKTWIAHVIETMETQESVRPEDALAWATELRELDRPWSRPICEALIRLAPPWAATDGWGWIALARTGTSEYPVTLAESLLAAAGAPDAWELSHRPIEMGGRSLTWLGWAAAAASKLRHQHIPKVTPLLALMRSAGIDLDAPTEPGGLPALARAMPDFYKVLVLHGACPEAPAGPGEYAGLGWARPPVAGAGGAERRRWGEQIGHYLEAIVELCTVPEDGQSSAALDKNQIQTIGAALWPKLAQAMAQDGAWMQWGPIAMEAWHERLTSLSAAWPSADLPGLCAHALLTSCADRESVRLHDIQWPRRAWDGTESRSKYPVAPASQLSGAPSEDWQLLLTLLRSTSNRPRLGQTRLEDLRHAAEATPVASVRWLFAAVVLVLGRGSRRPDVWALGVWKHTLEALLKIQAPNVADAQAVHFPVKASTPFLIWRDFCWSTAKSEPSDTTLASVVWTWMALDPVSVPNALDTWALLDPAGRARVAVFIEKAWRSPLGAAAQKVPLSPTQRACREAVLLTRIEKVPEAPHRSMQPRL